MPVEDANGLVIRAAEDPRKLPMKLHSPNVVRMVIESVQRFSLIQVPDLDFEVVATRDKKRLGFVYINASDWSHVLFEVMD